MMEKDDDILEAMPERLRAARKQLGLSLDAVANLSGVSRSMVSQIERGESSPTIATLWNLTKALQVDFAGLLEQGPAVDSIHMLRADETPRIDNMGRGCRIAILSPPEGAGIQEIYDISFSADGQLDSQAHGRGTREHLTVLEGAVHIASGRAEDVASAGDTARYAADVPHTISAKDGAARIILIVNGRENSV